MSTTSLPPSPLYDPKAKVRNFKFHEDIKNIRLNLLGTGLLYEDDNFMYHLGDDMEWRRPQDITKHPIFIDGRCTRFDALQGATADCWLVASIEAICSNTRLLWFVVPQEQSFIHDYVGAFHFRIWQVGTWYDVVVDDRLPVNKSTGRLAYTHSKEHNIFWAALLEKAYLKVNGFHSDGLIDHTYEGLSAGSPVNAMKDLTGGIIEVVQPETYRRKKTIHEYLRILYSYDALMCVVRYEDTPDKGVQNYHSYSITKVVKFPDDDEDYPGFFLVRLMNPWGTQEWTGDWGDLDINHWRTFSQTLRRKMGYVVEYDGEFWMNEHDFGTVFQVILICHLGPGRYLRGQHIVPYFVHWKTAYFNGEWVRGVSAVGLDSAQRHMNPQFRFKLSQEEDASKDGKVTVVIDVTRSFKPGRFGMLQQGRDSREGTMIFLYDLTKEQNPPNHLDQMFLKSHKPINNLDDVSMLVGRGSYGFTMDLSPGEYCAIPCTQHADFEAQFLLRVFSESPVDISEYDDQISRSLPVEEKTPIDKNDENLQKLFDDVALGQNEIEWEGLKHLLCAAMNPKRSYFTTASLFQCAMNIFRFIFPLLGDDSGEVVFTKDQCRKMVAMLDDNHSGKLSFSEFSNLWTKICFWSEVYKQYSDEWGGYLTVSQLRDALGSIGYNTTLATVHSLCYVYADERGHIHLTDFINCGVTIETILNLRHRICDEKRRSEITFTLEDWVKNTLIL